MAVEAKVNRVMDNVVTASSLTGNVQMAVEAMVSKAKDHVRTVSSLTGLGLETDSGRAASSEVKGNNLARGEGMAN